MKKTNIERIQEKAEKEIRDVELWQLNISILKIKIQEIYDNNGLDKDSYEYFSSLLLFAEDTVCYDPNYFINVNKILEPIYQKI